MAGELRAERYLAIALINKYTLSMASVPDEMEIGQSEEQLKSPMFQFLTRGGMLFVLLSLPMSCRLYCASGEVRNYRT